MFPIIIILYRYNIDLLKWIFRLLSISAIVLAPINPPADFSHHHRHRRSMALTARICCCPGIDFPLIDAILMKAAPGAANH